MAIRWINSKLGTAPAHEVINRRDITIIDVRDLVDKAGNNTEFIKKKIDQAGTSVVNGNTTVICCDYGISRSNAIAVGVLAKYETNSFEDALKAVLVATGEKDIKISLLQSVRKALEQNEKPKRDELPQILITGASGSIGKILSKYLEDKYKQYSPQRSQINLELGSTELDLYATENQITHLVHLANPRVFTSNIAIGQTLTMLSNIIDVCISKNINLIFLSSIEVYSGYRASQLLADEGLPLLPKGPYGESKFLCEKLIQLSRKTKGLKCTILRSSPVYGPSLDKPKFLLNFIKKIQHSQNLVTHIYNNTEPAIDLLYSDDLIRAIELVIEKNFIGDLNIGTSMTYTTSSIAKCIQSLIGGHSKLSQIQIDADTSVIAMDYRFAKNTLGWSPHIDLQTGIKNVIGKLES